MFSLLIRQFKNSALSLSKKDYYKILGISKTSTEEQIKLAYFSLAKKLHPDINKSPNSQKEFSAINEAYQTLGDPTKRKYYDVTGMTGDEQDQIKQNNFENQEFYDWEEFLEDIGENLKGSKQKKEKGQDITIAVQLSFMDAAFGTVKKLNVTRKDTCRTCKGSKVKKNSQKKDRCRVCNGKGVVKMDLGFLEIEQDCGKCNGTGFSKKVKCETCNGSGLAVFESVENIDIPAGINNGDKLVIEKKGHKSKSGGRPGDIFVKVQIKDHDFFRRNGCNVQSDIYITLPQSVLGGLVEARTLNGKSNLKIEPGTNTGDSITLPGMGVVNFPYRINEKGDLIYTVHVVTPKNLTNRQRELYEELARYSV